MARAIEVYLEVGSKRAFAGAIDWPGWSRMGRDEDAAMEALASSAGRFGRVLRGTRLGFRGSDAPDLKVMERLKGDATTDFGAPSITPSADKAPLTPADLDRLERILRATWRALDRAVEEAGGRRLHKGPRGGGRSLDKIVEHVVDAEGGYLRALGWKLPAGGGDARDRIDSTRDAVIEGLRASMRGEIEPRGPRGGVRWRPRYFIRRTAWHAVDHAWEIEDRLE